MLLMMALLMMALFGCGSGGDLELHPASPEPVATIDSDQETVSEETGVATLMVHVCGAVAQPGVYELAKGSRVCDAVAAAGGMLDTADREAVNLAQPLEDAQQVRVPVQGEAAVAASEETGGKVNLNKADKEQLMTLSGIGESKAEAILRYREKAGGFRSVEELMNVEGIKEGTYNKIKDDVTV